MQQLERILIISDDSAFKNDFSKKYNIRIANSFKKLQDEIQSFEPQLIISPYLFKNKSIFSYSSLKKISKSILHIVIDPLYNEDAISACSGKKHLRYLPYFNLNSSDLDWVLLHNYLKFNHNGNSSQTIIEEKVCRDFLSSILESITNPLYIIDAREHYIMMENTAAKNNLLIRCQECDKLIDFHNHTCYLNKGYCLIKQMLDIREPINFEIHSPQDNTYYEINSYPVVNSDSSVTEIIINVQDITEKRLTQKKMIQLAEDLEDTVEERTKDLIVTLEKLKKAQKELSEALEKEKEINTMKSRFISMISHEYRTPLTIISTSAYLLDSYQKMTKENPDMVKHIQRILSSVRDLTSLIDDALTIESSNESELRLNFTHFALEELLKDVIETQKIKEHKHQHFHFSTKCLVQNIYSDKTMVRQIFQNIISNSIKYSEEETDIFVQLYLDDEKAKITVKDEGVGFNDEDKKHLFETFYRNQNMIGLKKGSGLGLSIVKRCIDALEGDIEILSSLGEGSTVRMIIPNKKRFGKTSN